MKKEYVLVVALIVVLASLFFLVDNITQHNEEKRAGLKESINNPPSTLEGKIFFDLNGNFRLDESDVQVMEPVGLTMVQHFPESENTYDFVSVDGQYYLAIPSTAQIIKIYLNSSTEELNGMIDSTDQNVDFRVFRFKLINETVVDELWQPDGSVVWIPEGESIADILIIGIE